MEINIYELIEGAQSTEGLTVIIDVFRAFSLEAYLFSQGVRRIFAVGKEETAWNLKRQYPQSILIGERGGKILPGFDYGNSPWQTRHLSIAPDASLEAATVIHTTSAGTQGLVHTAHTSKQITGSLVNARAIADYIRKVNPDKVSLLAMGLAGKKSSREDLLCARYIKSLLENKPMDMDAEVLLLKYDAQGKKFFDPETQDIFPQEDFNLCTKYDIMNLVLEVEQIDEDIFMVTKHEDEE